MSEPCWTPCAIEQGMRILGGKWTGSLLWHLRDGPMRFNALARAIAGASKKMISARLRHLEAQGLIRREVEDTIPVVVRYELTEQGRSALDCLDALRRWGETLPAPQTERGEDGV